MSAAERRDELCALLAIGLIRLRLRQSSELSADDADKSLHFGARESVCRDDRKGDFR